MSESKGTAPFNADVTPVRGGDDDWFEEENLERDRKRRERDRELAFEAEVRQFRQFCRRLTKGRSPQLHEVEDLPRTVAIERCAFRVNTPSQCRKIFRRLAEKS